MPAMSVQDMISQIRKLVDDPSPGMQHTDSEILASLNQAVGAYDAILSNHARRLFVQYKDVTHDGSELQRVAPYLPRIVGVERTSVDPRSRLYPVFGGWAQRHMYVTGGTEENNAMNRFYVQNNQLGMLPPPSSGTDRVWMTISSPKLCYGKVTSWTAGTKALVVVDPPDLGALVKMDDAYNEMVIMLTATEELNTIVDWDMSTLTMTLATVPENTPALNTVYSIIPRVHPEFHMGLVYHTVAILREGTDEDSASAKALERNVIEEMLRYVATEQDDQEDSIDIEQLDYWGTLYG